MTSSVILNWAMDLAPVCRLRAELVACHCVPDQALVHLPGHYCACEQGTGIATPEELLIAIGHQNPSSLIMLSLSTINLFMINSSVITSTIFATINGPLLFPKWLICSKFRPSLTGLAQSAF